MPNGFSRSPKLLKGALVELAEPFLGPIPNIILFQYNPESMKRDLTPWSAPNADGSEPTAESLAQPFDPGEKFTLTLELDATDALEEPYTHPVALVSGVADRIAALEMLLYPSGGTSGVTGDALTTLFGSVDAVPRGSVPVVLFVWGPGRIVPVRLQSFSVDEEAFNTLLYPVRAKVTVALKVLTDAAFPETEKVKRTQAEDLAVKAYKWTRGQKEVLARLNLANSAESILGMLPY